MIGNSNKSFIDKIAPTDIQDRLYGTISANVISVLNGANIIRVHNVRENKKAMEVTDSLKFF